ncbi:hypothetical protein FRC02_003812, partial [Tulasnella sp. 418]
DQYDAAESALKEARNEFISLENNHEASYCLASIGIISRLQQNYDAAQLELKEAQMVLSSFGDHAWVAWCQKQLDLIPDAARQSNV